MGNTLNTTVDAFQQIFGAANTGTNLTDDGYVGADPLTFTPLNYDFDLNGVTDNNDITALANAVLPVVQRALEPFDIDVVIANATNLADAATMVGNNAGDGTGEFDAYVFCMTITSTGNGGGSVGNNTGLFGQAAAIDLNGQVGNTVDEASQTYADSVFGSTTGTPGTAQFNANLAQRMGYTATHEGFHTFSYVHTPDENPPTASNNARLLASGDVIRRGSNTRENPFIVTRFDLQHDGAAVPEPNNYLLAANDPDIGLEDSDADGRPDLAYSTGTGAHDQVILANTGGGIIDVDVNAFSDAARTASIASETYNIDLAVDTEGTVLVDASINNDEVRLDASIAALMRLRAGEGIDGIATENDLLTLNSGATPGTYTPGAAEAGTVVYAGGSTVNYSEFENVEADNVPVVVNPLVLSKSSINENDSITLDVSFVAIDTQDTHDVVIDWGDGSPNTVFSVAAGVRSFSKVHQYLDDNPTGTPVDVNTIKVTVTDDDADTGSNTAPITVANLDPVLTATDNSADLGTKAKEGEIVTVTGAFTDVGTKDTHTVSLDWGDGNVTAGTVVQGAGSGTFDGGHAYASGGIYTVTITLTDDDTGTDSAVETVFITGAGVQTIDGKEVLFVVGTNEADLVHVNALGDGTVRVHANFLPGGQRDFAVPIDEIRLFLCAGDDRGTIAGSVAIPAILDGGPGSDRLNAGKAGAVLLGRGGDDHLVGGSGSDVLIGGDGVDRLVGNQSSDILIGGIVTYEQGGEDAILANQANLLSILAEWNSGRPLDVRQSNINGTGVGPRLNGTNFLQSGVTVLDDGDADKLTGSAGIDWYFQDPGDTLTGYHEGDEFLN
jgi:hypothetical protein